MIKTQWNTGRQYAEDGQRIVATYDPESGLVRFADHSRCIAGQFVVDFYHPEDEQTIRDSVMRVYDNNGYRDDFFTGLDWED